MKELEINSMRIEGEDIFDFVVPFDKFGIDLLKRNSFVNVHSEIQRIRNRFFAKIDVSFTLRLSCSRCLNEFDKPIEEHVDVYFEDKNVIDSDLKNGYDSSVYEYSGSIIDLTQMVYDTIVTSVPMKPLCNPHCEGVKVEDKNIDIKLSL